LSEDEIRFTAVLPNTQTAISISGTGDGARVKLDVANEDLAQVLRLVLLQGHALEVTIKGIS